MKYLVENTIGHLLVQRSDVIMIKEVIGPIFAKTIRLINALARLL